MNYAPEGKKKTYFSPTLRKLTPEEAIKFVRKCGSASDPDAPNLLDSLQRRREAKQKEQSPPNGSNGSHIRSA